mgnify:FL=1
MNNDTTITYERVEADAETIRGCSANMKSIFDDFSSTMNNIFSSGMFEGQASQQFQSEYNQLKSKFDSYTSLVEQFANNISSANQTIKQTEQSILRDTENL